MLYSMAAKCMNPTKPAVADKLIGEERYNCKAKYMVSGSLVVHT